MAGAFTGIGLTAGAGIVAGGLMMRTSSVLGCSFESDLGIFLPGSLMVSPAGGMVVTPQPLVVPQLPLEHPLEHPQLQPPWKQRVLKQLWPQSRLNRPFKRPNSWQPPSLQPVSHEEAQPVLQDEVQQLVVQLLRWRQEPDQVQHLGVLQQLVLHEGAQESPHPRSRLHRLRKQSRRRWPNSQGAGSQQVVPHDGPQFGVWAVAIDAATTRNAIFTRVSSVETGARSPSWGRDARLPACRCLRRFPPWNRTVPAESVR